MVNQLEVWLFDNHVGILEQTRGELTFLYNQSWLDNPKAIALSCSLPLQSEPFSNRLARPFFAGLLPEGNKRNLIAQQLKVSNKNDFALLDSIGGECAGAITFLEPGQPLPRSSSPFETHWLKEHAVLMLLDEMPRRPMLVGENGLRLSLAGAQDKLPVIFDGKRIGLPLHGSPSSHILKPEIPGVRDSVVNEGFCMELAKVLGINVAETHIHHVRDKRVLLVKRYDRYLDEKNHLKRLHQEDFCQALGIEPEIKYQSEGGPNLADCFSLLRRVTQPSAPHILSLLDFVIFNTLVGNHDAHAKNFSLLHAHQGIILAPLYDALSTSIYPELTSKMAMKLGSKYKFNDVQSRHWDQFAEATGLSVAQTRQRVLTLSNKLPLAANQLEQRQESEFTHNPLVRHIINEIEKRVTRTIQQLK
jgi:serine/threonine-protein kinase HipA